MVEAGTFLGSVGPFYDVEEELAAFSDHGAGHAGEHFESADNFVVVFREAFEQVIPVFFRHSAAYSRGLVVVEGAVVVGEVDVGGSFGEFVDVFVEVGVGVDVCVSGVEAVFDGIELFAYL